MQSHGIDALAKCDVGKKEQLSRPKPPNPAHPKACEGLCCHERLAIQMRRARCLLHVDTLGHLVHIRRFFRLRRLFPLVLFPMRGFPKLGDRLIHPAKIHQPVIGHESRKVLAACFCAGLHAIGV